MRWSIALLVVAVGALSAVADEPTKWKEFVAAYAKELQVEPARKAARDLRERGRREPVTLLYAARDETHNNAAALKGLLEDAA